MISKVSECFRSACFFLLSKVIPYPLPLKVAVWGRQLNLQYPPQSNMTSTFSHLLLFPMMHLYFNDLFPFSELFLWDLLSPIQLGCLLNVWLMGCRQETWRDVLIHLPGIFAKKVKHLDYTHWKLSQAYISKAPLNFLSNFLRIFLIAVKLSSINFAISIISCPILDKFSRTIAKVGSFASLKKLIWNQKVTSICAFCSWLQWDLFPS